ncbi:hypothetical protein ACHHYP_20316 [Achlya hypogyna]|uniref:Tc1-like transposase DDE domain-containing protein n=1 Tax=Achlya hypogyna TaxID=1202772 RepID=A0A1V9YR47_ACHHY|nr:hypothetical protein ACHHYP_20316 [Achlya hypogyna]
MTSTSLRRLFREAGKGRSSTRKLVTNLNLPIKHRRGKSELRVLEGNQTSYDYVTTVADYMLDFAHANHGLDFVFQQDNASIHVRYETTGWLDDQEITRLKWPALSPDFNPIENLWAIMERKVYANGRQFTSREALKSAVLKVWDEIPQETFFMLVDSMTNRCAEVLLKRGNNIDY